MHTCAGPKVKPPPGEVSQQEASVLIQRIPAGLPDSPTPDTGTPRSCYWAQVMLLSLEPGWICLKLRKPAEFFGTLKVVQTVFSNQLHSTSRQDGAWKASALLYCENRQSKSTFISIVSLLRYSGVE